RSPALASPRASGADHAYSRSDARNRWRSCKATGGARMTVPLITAPNAAAEETSNFHKHTNGNPLQRRLIDRFHHLLMAKIGELAPSSFLDAGCGEGFVSEILI